MFLPNAANLTYVRSHTGNVDHAEVYYPDLLKMWTQSQSPRYAYTTVENFHNGPPIIVKVDFFYSVTEANYQAFRVNGRVSWSCPSRGRQHKLTPGKYLDSSGEGLEYRHFSVDVPSFQGSRRVTALEAYPLEYHPNYGDKLRRDFTARGEMFVKLSGGLECHRAYQGLAWYQADDGLISNCNVNSRIMIDPATHNKEMNRTLWNSVAKVEAADLLPEEYMTAAPCVSGWCFSKRQWMFFDVSRISDMAWKSQPLDTLDLDSKEKNFVKVISSPWAARFTHLLSPSQTRMLTRPQKIAMRIRHFLINRIGIFSCWLQTS